MRTPSGTAFARRSRSPWLALAWCAALWLGTGCQRDPSDTPVPATGAGTSAGSGAARPAAPRLPAGDDEGGGGGGGGRGGGSAKVPAELALTIKSAAGTTTLTGDQIAALPREPMPGEVEQDGWRLAALLEAAGLTTYERLRLRDDAGASLTLERADFSDSSIPFLRVNRRGILRFRVLQKTTSGWTATSDLRGLIEIDAK